MAAIARRIGRLPVGLQGKMSFIGTYLQNRITYGCIVGSLKPKQAAAYNSSLWQAAGHLSYAVPQLKTIIGGAHAQAQEVILMRNIRNLAKLKDKMKHSGVVVVTALQIMVFETLEMFGWFLDRATNIWHHSVLSYQFEIESLVVNANWHKTAHGLRQSFRWSAYMSLESSNRHEFKDQCIPEFNEARLDLVRQWSKTSTTAYVATMGAIKSGKVRWINTPRHGKNACSICGDVAPNWEHPWLCGLKRQVPDDVMLARFLWPRTKDDLQICNLAVDLIGKIFH